MSQCQQQGGLDSSESQEQGKKGEAGQREAWRGTGSKEKQEVWL